MNTPDSPVSPTSAPAATSAGEWSLPKGSSTSHTFKPAGGEGFPYTADACWMPLYKEHRPVAEMFHVSYVKESKGRAGSGKTTPRPLTFVFNGGPGAASAYLHMGALGPQRVAFNADGSVPAMPAKLAPNHESWLPFTDLVFIDPIGTGFSRVIPEAKGKEGDDAQEKADKKTEAKAEEFYSLNRDLETLCELITGYLSAHDRWLSPVYIAGESYGGFRVAKLARKLQNDYGVGLKGAILISPALEWYLLVGSDYDVLTWAGALPTMVAAAFHHGRATAFPAKTPLAKVLAEAERFTVEEFVPLLTAGDGLGNTRRQAVLEKLAAYTGLPVPYLNSHGGRVDIMDFCRTLLRDQGRVLGLYDASMSAMDPFPDRNQYEGPEPSLGNADFLFNAGINTQLRATLKLDTERRYHLLSEKVFHSWKVDQKRHAFDSLVGSTDDLRFGMSLNPHMNVAIIHGLYDLVTPYYNSTRIADLMKLPKDRRTRLTLKNYPGGHMFYSWDKSRKDFTADMKVFYGEGK